MARDDKLIVLLEAGDKVDVEQEEEALHRALLLDVGSEDLGWHPADYGIGPEGLTDDERDVYC